MLEVIVLLKDGKRVSEDYGGNRGGSINRGGRENTSSPFLDLDFSKRKIKKLKGKRIKSRIVVVEEKGMILWRGEKSEKSVLFGYC